MLLITISNYGPTLLEECHEVLSKKGVPLASNQISLVNHYGQAANVRGPGGALTDVRRPLSKCRRQRAGEAIVAKIRKYPFARGAVVGKNSRRDAGAEVVGVNQERRQLVKRSKRGYRTVQVQVVLQGDERQARRVGK